MYKSKLPDGRCVYVIYNPDTSAIKIGVSNDPLGRMSNLQVACGSKLELKCSTLPLTNYDSIERDCHRHFKKYHRLGEWFNLSSDVAIDYIKSVDMVHDRISKLYLDGYSITDIANHYYVSRQAIIKRLKGYRLHNKDVPPVHNKKLPSIKDMAIPKEKKEVKSNDIVSEFVLVSDPVEVSLNMSEYDRIGKNKYKHKRTGAVQMIRYFDGKFRIVD